jgi:hypothetical protein
MTRNLLQADTSRWLPSSHTEAADNEDTILATSAQGYPSKETNTSIGKMRLRTDGMAAFVPIVANASRAAGWLQNEKLPHKRTLNSSDVSKSKVKHTEGRLSEMVRMQTLAKWWRPLQRNVVLRQITLMLVHKTWVKRTPAVAEVDTYRLHVLNARAFAFSRSRLFLCMQVHLVPIEILLYAISEPASMPHSKIFLLKLKLRFPEEWSSAAGPFSARESI